jgi:hypothetical protein
MQFDRLRRRHFISLLIGVAAAALFAGHPLAEAGKLDFDHFTAVLKCDAKAIPTVRFFGIGKNYFDAIKDAIAKAENAGWGGDACFGLKVDPEPEGMFGCSTKSCPPGRGGFKRQRLSE